MAHNKPSSQANYNDPSGINHYAGARTHPSIPDGDNHIRRTLPIHGKDQDNGYKYRIPSGTIYPDQAGKYNSTVAAPKTMAQLKKDAKKFGNEMLKIHPRPGDVKQLKDLRDFDAYTVKLEGYDPKISMTERVSLALKADSAQISLFWRTRMALGIINKHSEDIASDNIEFENKSLGDAIKRLPKVKKSLKDYRAYINSKKTTITKTEKEVLRSRISAVERTLAEIEKNFNGGDLGVTNVNQLANSGKDHEKVLRWFYNQPDAKISEKDKIEFAKSSSERLQRLLKHNKSFLDVMQKSVVGYVNHLGENIPKELKHALENPGQSLTPMVVSGAAFWILANNRKAAVPGFLIGSALNFPSLFTNAETGGPSKVIGSGIGALAAGYMNEWSGKGTALGAVVLNPSVIGAYLKATGSLASTITMSLDKIGSGAGLDSTLQEWNRMGMNWKRYGIQIFDNDAGKNVGRIDSAFGKVQREILENDLQSAPQEIQTLANHLNGKKIIKDKIALEKAIKDAGRFIGKTEHLSSQEDANKIYFNSLNSPDFNMNVSNNPEEEKKRKMTRIKYQLNFGRLLKEKIRQGGLINPNLKDIFDKSLKEGNLQRVSSDDEFKNLEKYLTNQAVGKNFAINNLYENPLSGLERARLMKKIPNQGYEFLKGATSTFTGTVITAYIMIFILANTVSFLGGKFSKYRDEALAGKKDSKELNTFHNKKLPESRKEVIRNKVKNSKNLGDVYNALRSKGFTKKSQAILNVVLSPSLLEILKKTEFKAKNPENFSKLIELLGKNTKASPQEIRSAFLSEIRNIDEVKGIQDLEEMVGVAEKKSRIAATIDKLDLLKSGYSADINLGDGTKVKLNKDGILKRGLKALLFRGNVEIVEDPNGKSGKAVGKMVKLKFEEIDGVYKYNLGGTNWHEFGGADGKSFSINPYKKAD